MNFLNIRMTQYNTIHCNVMQYNTTQYNTMQCNAVQCVTILSVVSASGMRSQSPDIQQALLQARLWFSFVIQTCWLLNLWIVKDLRGTFKATKSHLRNSTRESDQMRGVNSANMASQCTKCSFNMTRGRGEDVEIGSMSFSQPSC